MTLPVPRLRSDLVFTSDSVHDPRFQRTLRPRATERRVLDLLRAGVPSLPVLWQRLTAAQRGRGEAPLTPDDLYRRLWGLARDLWFELDVLPAYDRLFAWKPDAVPPDLVPDTSRATFLCTGCGRCCEATDIGPVGRAEAARIAAVVPGFEGHLTWVTDDVAVLGAGCARCPYQRPDGLCVLHGEHGPEAKPLVCRQFPYRFTVVDGRVEVTLDAECWQLPEALAAGRADPEAAARDVQAVWQLGPIVEHLPPVRFADPFTVLDDDAWGAAVAAFDRALGAGALPSEALLDLLRATPRQVPPFLDEAAWARGFGDAFQPATPRQREWALDQLQAHLATWAAGSPWRADLGAALLAGLRRVRDGEPPRPLTPPERELFVLALRTHLDARNVLKKDNLELGVVFLFWRTRLAEASLDATSAIDTLVASNKLPKDRRLGEYFRQNQVLFRRLAEFPVRSVEVRT